MKKRGDFADVGSRESGVKSERPTFESLNSQLDNGLTFARIAHAEYELGSRESAQRPHAEAEKSYTGAIHCLPLVQGLSAEQRRGLESKLEQLRDGVALLNQAPTLKE